MPEGKYGKVSQQPVVLSIRGLGGSGPWQAAVARIARGVLLLLLLSISWATWAHGALAMTAAPDQASAPGTPAAAPPATTVILPTDASQSWAKDAIAELYARGAVVGYPNGAFRPERAISRAEFAVMLAKALNIPLDANPGLVLLDNAEIQDWERAAVMTTFKDGIILSYQDGSFRPENTITRGELAVMADNTLGVSQPMTANLQIACADAASIPVWARGDIAYATGVGLFYGYPDGTFRALQPATRAEACAIVTKLLKLIKR